MKSAVVQRPNLTWPFESRAMKTTSAINVPTTAELVMMTMDTSRARIKVISGACMAGNDPKHTAENVSITPTYLTTFPTSVLSCESSFLLFHFFSSRNVLPFQLTPSMTISLILRLLSPIHSLNYSCVHSRKKINKDSLETPAKIFLSMSPTLNAE